jgi:hypothetical protein
MRHGIQAQAVQFALHDFTSLRDVLLAILPLEPLFDFGARALGLDVAQVGIEPVAAGAAALGRDNLHPIASLQRIIERDERAVHARPPAAIADVGVDVIGKVDGRAAGGHVH